jgi:hypothetical protein
MKHDPTSTPDYEIDEYTGKKYTVPAEFTEEARRLWASYSKACGSSERAFIHVVAPILAARRDPSETPRNAVVDVDAFLAEMEFEDAQAWADGQNQRPQNANLRTACLNAINKLESLGHTFSGPHFTDRYGDGPHCLDLAKRLKEAIGT